MHAAWKSEPKGLILNRSNPNLPVFQKRAIGKQLNSKAR